MVATNRSSKGKLPVLKSGGHGIESHLGQDGKNIPDVQKARNPRVEYTSTNKAPKRCAAMPLAARELVPERVQQAPVKPPLIRTGSWPFELRLVATNRSSKGKLPVLKWPRAATG